MDDHDFVHILTSSSLLSLLLLFPTPFSGRVVDGYDAEWSQFTVQNQVNSFNRRQLHHVKVTEPPPAYPVGSESENSLLNPFPTPFLSPFTLSPLASSTSNRSGCPEEARTSCQALVVSAGFLLLCLCHAPSRPTPPTQDPPSHSVCHPDLPEELSAARGTSSEGHSTHE